MTVIPPIGLLRLRMGCIDAAEALIGLISPDEDYPYEFIVFRIQQKFTST